MTKRISAILGLMGLLLILAGCGASQQDDFARRLKPGEAEKLLARQQAGKLDQEQEQEPQDPVQLEAQGDQLARSEDPSGALFKYNRALALVAEDERPRLRSKMAWIYLRMKQFPQALYLYRSLTDADPDRASAWEGLGMSLMGQEKMSEAEQAYLRAVELDHKLWKSYNSLGIIYNRTKHPIRAKSAFLRAIKLQPRQPALYNNLGMACLLGEDLAGAEWSFRRALGLDPDYRRAANNLGLVLARQHRYDQALNAFERGSGTAQAHNNLGCFLAWEGDYDQAAEQFNLAQHSNPVYYPLARKHLAEVSSKQGDGLEPRTGQNRKDLELLNGYLSPPASIQSGLSQEQEPAPGQGTEAVLTTSKDKAPVDSPRKPLPPDLAFPRLENLNSGSDSTVHKERYGMRNEDANFHIMREWLKGADIDE